MKNGDIVLIPFPFSDLTGSKLRPSVVLISSKLDVTVCFITTQFQWQTEYDLQLVPSEMNRLKRNSLLRIGKFATIDKDLVCGKLGNLKYDETKLLNKKLKAVLQL